MNKSEKIGVNADGKDNNKRDQKSSEIPLTKEFLGLRVSEVLDRLHSGLDKESSSAPTTHHISLGATGATGGLRSYLPESVGTGYLDTIKLSAGIFIGLVDANYREAYEVNFSAERLLTIRVICSGSIVFPQDETRLSEGSCSVQHYPADFPTSLILLPDVPIRMVVLFALPDAFNELGITSSMLSELLISKESSVGDSATDTKNKVSHFSVASSQKLLRIATDMLDSRYSLPHELQLLYVRGKAQELLCEIIVRAKPSVDMKITGNRIRKTDIARLHEVRRILLSNLESPPTIEQLSRNVGINQTKLKAGFRELFGETIQVFRTRVRLEEAKRLLEETEVRLSEIGQRTGYKYPPNFTKAVKQYFGVSPLQLRKSYSISNNN